MTSTVLPPHTCPVCGSKSGFTVFCPASFLGAEMKEIIECKDCHMGILWPLPSEEDFSVFYGKDYFNFDRDSEVGKGYYYAEILKKQKTKGRYLEIGSALGWFLYGIKNNSEWEISALETGKTAAAFSREKLGLNVTESQLQKAGYPENYFDFIRFNNVLEHMPNPGEAFAKAAKSLAPGGTLYISVPNGGIDRLASRSYYKKTGKPAASKDGHVFFFSKKSIYKMAAVNGLKITQAYSTGIKHSLRELDLWPKKNGWETLYQPRAIKNIKKTGAGLPEEIAAFKKPSVYYKYSLYRDLYTRLPGLLDFASDYIVYFQK